MIPLDSPKDWADGVRLLRTLAGLRQIDLAGVVGTTRDRIGDYERGKYVPGLGLAMRILASMGYRLAIIPMSVQESETQESDSEERGAT